MPWKMILVIAVILLVGIFAGFNLNQTTISIGFHSFENVPVFLALIIAFIMGAGVMLPFTIKTKVSKKQEEKILKKKAKEEKKKAKEEEKIKKKNEVTEKAEPVTQEEKKNKKEKK